MTYILENKDEFDRLEKQSKTEAYNYAEELKEFHPKPFSTLLDAGCGSGIVSRYLARTYPQSQVVGCDLSPDRIQRARSEIGELKNLTFQNETLTALSFKDSSFDAVVCRYVLEHLQEKDIQKALSEFYRCIRPGGSAQIIDMDGLLCNLFPQTELVKKVLLKLEHERPIDLNIGRKLPQYLAQAGFTGIQWRIETLQFQGEKLPTEITLLRERFQQVKPFLISFLGSETTAQRFTKEYMDCLRAPQSVLFYNKFIVWGEKRESRG